MRAQPLFRRRAARAMLAGGFGVCLVATTAAAQAGDQAARVRHRNECRLAAQVLDTGDPATRRAWAILRAPGCPEQGPRVLASQWRLVPQEGATLDDLTRASMRIHDGRLFSELVRIVRDASRPGQVRVAAMLVLTKYVNRSSAVWLTDLIPPDTIRYIPTANGSTTHQSYHEGAVPLPESYSLQMLDVLRSMDANRSSQPREVWYAAAMLRKRLEAGLHRNH